MQSLSECGAIHNLRSITYNDDTILQPVRGTYYTQKLFKIVYHLMLIQKSMKLSHKCSNYIIQSCPSSRTKWT
jgi:hypothetical protein